jgi:Ras-related protein Rap-2C
MIIFSFSLAH